MQSPRDSPESEQLSSYMEALTRSLQNVNRHIYLREVAYAIKGNNVITGYAGLSEKPKPGDTAVLPFTTSDTTGLSPDEYDRLVTKDLNDTARMRDTDRVLNIAGGM